MYNVHIYEVSVSAGCVAMVMTDSLKILIIEHHEAFASLYSSCFIPKLHFLIHYPEQMLQVGSMVRMENKTRGKVISSSRLLGHRALKNITLSLANHHQCLVCYEMSIQVVFCIPG